MVTRVGANTPIYCLSEGATLPTWVTSDRARRKALKADERLNRRVELLQGLEFDGGVSRRVKYSSDGSMLVVTGEYPPACKVYDLSQLGMKYERRLRAPCVDVWPLAPDLGKMVFLLDDRTLDFHAPYRRPSGDLARRSWLCRVLQEDGTTSRPRPRRGRVSEETNRGGAAAGTSRGT